MQSLKAIVDKKDAEISELKERLKIVTEKVTASKDEQSREIDKKVYIMQKEILKIVNEKVHSIKTHNQSYASATKRINGPNTNKIQNEEGNLSKVKHESTLIQSEPKQMNEEDNMKERRLNIIIHGKHEKTEQEDEEFVNKLIENVTGNVAPSSFTRIGKQGNDRRPIKVIFSNEEHKMKVMSNLRNLKGNERFKKISVTDDYTLQERQ